MQQLATCITPMLLVLNSLQLAKARPTMSYILLVHGHGPNTQSAYARVHGRQFISQQSYITW